MDAISRLQFKKLYELDPLMDQLPQAVLDQIWPIEKIWLK